jgi:hypothetical protein
MFKNAATGIGEILPLTRTARRSNLTILTAERRFWK